MAKLICKDGTKILISDETEQSLREKFGKKRKFEPITIDDTTIAIREGRGCPIAIQVGSWYDSKKTRKEAGLGEGHYDIHGIGNAQEVIAAIQSAIDYIENQ